MKKNMEQKMEARKEEKSGGRGRNRTTKCRHPTIKAKRR